MNDTLREQQRAHWFISGFAATKLLLHLLTSSGYGYFRDELYYLACADRLAWGYVDHPPFSVAALAFFKAIFGDSLLALRFLPGLLGAATIVLVGLMVLRLGGRLWALVLALTATLFTPVFLALNHFYSMNSWEIFFWTLATWLLIELIEAPTNRRWAVLGLVLGLGLLNKISVLWWGAGLAVALVLTPLRAQLRTRGPWLCAALAGLIFAPHVLWQVGNGWPTREFIANATQNKMQASSPLDFLLGQLDMMTTSLLLWLVGLLFVLFHPAVARFRALAWIYLTVFAILAFAGASRSVYLAPAYTWLFAAGGVAFERLDAGRRRFLRPAFLIFLVALGLLVTPLALPILPIEKYLPLARAMGEAPSTEERHELGRLGQFFADMHGWPEIVGQVAAVHAALPPEDKAVAAIFAPNYGVAGAVDHFGQRYGLPKAISGHNNYWLWGPGGWDGKVLIVIGGKEAKLRELFDRVEKAGRTACGDCMPYENDRQIWIARGLKGLPAELWPSIKHYD